MDPKVRQRVQEFFADVRQIPTLPDVYYRVKKVFEEPSLSIEYLADAIRLDQALTISLLRLANSPLFGFRQKISSISQAIMLIGLREVYSLVLSVSVMGLCPIDENDEKKSLFPANEFWRHSLATAIAAKAIGTQMGENNSEELFVAGLIHDIGKLIEKIYMKDQFESLCQIAHEKNLSLYEVEKEELGFTHAEVGQILTEAWRFPQFLIDTTGNHHHPEELKDLKARKGAQIVSLANSIVRGMNLGWGGDPFVPEINQQQREDLKGFPFDAMEQVMLKIDEEYQVAVEALLTPTD